MKAFEIMDDLFSLARPGDFSQTCDTCKAGSPQAEVTKVAVSMFATPEVIRQASRWGAQMLIVHEPACYNHMDFAHNEALEREKRRFLAESGLTVYRFHDHCHAACPDIISAGELEALGLDCEAVPDMDTPMRLRLNTPMTPRELARLVEERLGLAHVRICGAADTSCVRVSCMFGTPGGILEEMLRPDCQIVLTGEICEWAEAEWVRDMAQMGHTKALLVLGHIGSERDGMRHTARILQNRHPELAVQYLECGEVFTYTDLR